MQGRVELLDAGGGDKVQVQNTAKELKNLGIEVDINTELEPNLKDYDVVHVFQLDWIAENYFQTKNAKNQGKPVVLSPIHHSQKEVKLFDDTFTYGFRRISGKIFKDQFKRDTLKNVYRTMLDGRKIKPTMTSILKGLKQMHINSINNSDIILVQTETEAKDLAETYGVEFKWKKIPNGVGRHFIHKDKFENKFDFKDYIVCVGRIEPRKNQISIIEAVKKFRENSSLDVKIVFVGKESTAKHFEYIGKFKSLKDKYNWIFHVERVPYEDMPDIYHYAKVCVSASWFETTGLTSLEALYCGTNAVASGERAQEYLGSYASYCDPSKVDSIYGAIKKEYEAKRPVINEEMKVQYTWENAAKKTMQVYEELLKHK